MTDTALEISNDTVGSEGIFLRTADRRRFEYVMRGVQQQSLSLALSSENDGVLDHYGRLVINKLRKMADLQIEVFLPQNTEALLERFNQILSGLSLEDARNGENSPAPRRVLIAHDAKAISARDLQLLSRLVQDFPGANVSLVMLLDKTGIAQHEKSLDNFGQRMLRWPLEQPTRTEGEALLKVARAMGFEVEVKKVLAATGFAELRVQIPVGAAGSFERQLSDNRIRKQPPAQTPMSAPAPVDKTPQEPASDSIFTEAPQHPSPLKTLLGWVLAISLLLAVAVSTVALMFPQRLTPMLANSPTLKQTLPPWMMSLVVQMAGKPSTGLPEAPPESASTPDSTAIQPQAADRTTSVPPATADSVTNEIATVTLPAPADSMTSPDNGSVKPVETPKPVNATTVVANVPDAATTKLPDEDPLAARSERGVDQVIRQAPEGSFFVQHVSLNSMAEAQEWRAQYRALSGARIAAVTTQNKGIRYVVISGPLANMKEAETFARREGIPTEPWLRPVTSLRRALQPANR